MSNSFGKLWGKYEVFRKLLMKTTFFQNFDWNQDFSEITSEFEIIRKFSTITEILGFFLLKQETFGFFFTKIEIFRQFWLKSRFFRKFRIISTFFEKFWLKSRFFWNFVWIRDLWKILTKIHIFDFFLVNKDDNRDFFLTEIETFLKLCLNSRFVDNFD